MTTGPRDDDDDPVLGASLAETARLNSPETRAGRANRAAVAKAGQGAPRPSVWIVAATVVAVAVLLALGIGLS